MKTNIFISERPYPAFAVPVPYRTFWGKYGRTRTRTRTFHMKMFRSRHLLVVAIRPGQPQMVRKETFLPFPQAE